MLHISMYINSRDSAQILRETILTYLRANKSVSTLSTYCKPDGIRKCIEEDDTDIYIIDFSEAQTGKNLMEQIRRKTLIPAIIMVNIDCKTMKKYLFLRPSALIEDVKNTQELLQAISDLKSEAISANRYFSFKCDGEMMRISYDNIEYFESNARKVTLYTFDRTVTYYFSAKLDDIARILPDNFLRCHQSYIVNMKHISKFDRTNRTFCMLSKDEVFVSRRMYTEASARYEKYALTKHS